MVKDTKMEAIELLIKKGYWRIVKMAERQGYMKVEVCSAKHQELLALQQVFGGKIKKQDSIWRWFCGKAVDVAHIATSLLPYAYALAVEMHRYCQASGERRYLYVQAIREKYETNSIKISKFTTPVERAGEPCPRCGQVNGPEVRKCNCGTCLTCD